MGPPTKHVSNYVFLNWESVVPKVPRTAGLPWPQGEARGPLIRPNTLGLQPFTFPRPRWRPGVFKFGGKLRFSTFLFAGHRGGGPGAPNSVGHLRALKPGEAQGPQIQSTTSPGSGGGPGAPNSVENLRFSPSAPTPPLQTFCFFVQPLTLPQPPFPPFFQPFTIPSKGSRS